MTENTCGCTDEYGPCDAHGDILIVRDGASVRTADESAVLFIEDACSLGAALSPYGDDVLKRANEALEANRSQASGVAWLDDEGLHDEVMTVYGQVETELATLGIYTYQQDGYWMVRPSEDCPLTQDGEE